MGYRRYKGAGGKSAITEYEIGYNFVRVRFGNAKSRWNPSKTYQWTIYGIGEDLISEMKRLAEAGNGLEEFILRNCAKSVSRIF